VSEWLPLVNVVTARLADPPARGTVPSTVAPSLKVTLPVTVPDPGATTLTVAAKVTDWPVPEGFGEAVNVVFVVTRFTI
jgi:hypothetical protein